MQLLHHPFKLNLQNPKHHHYARYSQAKRHLSITDLCSTQTIIGSEIAQENYSSQMTRIECSRSTKKQNYHRIINPADFSTNVEYFAKNKQF